VTTTATGSHPVATPRISAGALFLDDQGRILLLRPTYKSYWDIPGGYVEPGESPRAACAREIYEELGIRVRVGRLLSVDWAPHPDEGDKVLFIFDAGWLTAEQLAQITFQDGEIAEYAFVEPERLEQFTIPRLIRRLRATIRALTDRQPAYLEDGAPQPQAPALVPGLRTCATDQSRDVGDTSG
jgi:ADP-ribose pyrophosphatase YjhB (NUDIX family)